MNNKETKRIRRYDCSTNFINIFIYVIDTCQGYMSFSSAVNCLVLLNDWRRCQWKLVTLNWWHDIWGTMRKHIKTSIADLIQPFNYLRFVIRFFLYILSFRKQSKNLQWFQPVALVIPEITKSADTVYHKEAFSEQSNSFATLKMLLQCSIATQWIITCMLTISSSTLRLL